MVVDSTTTRSLQTIGEETVLSQIRVDRATVLGGGTTVPPARPLLRPSPTTLPTGVLLALLLVPLLPFLKNPMEASGEGLEVLQGPEKPHLLVLLTPKRFGSEVRSYVRARLPSPVSGRAAGLAACDVIWDPHLLRRQLLWKKVTGDDHGPPQGIRHHVCPALMICELAGTHALLSSQQLDAAYPADGQAQARTPASFLIHFCHTLSPCLAQPFQRRLEIKPLRCRKVCVLYPAYRGHER